MEAIFPLDESAGTIFIFLFGQISALVVIPLKGPLAQNLTEEDANIQVGFKEYITVRRHTLRKIISLPLPRPAPVLAKRLGAKITQESS